MPTYDEAINFGLPLAELAYASIDPDPKINFYKLRFINIVHINKTAAKDEIDKDRLGLKAPKWNETVAISC